MCCELCALCSVLCVVGFMLWAVGCGPWAVSISPRPVPPACCASLLLMPCPPPPSLTPSALDANTSPSAPNADVNYVLLAHFCCSPLEGDR